MLLFLAQITRSFLQLSVLLELSQHTHIQTCDTSTEHHTIGIYYSTNFSFLEVNHLHKTLNCHIISKLMLHFYLQLPSTHK